MRRVSKLLTVLVAIIGLVGSLLLPLQKAHADPACPVGKSLNVVAHEDDDLLFLNPAIQNDIAAGKCVETIYTTAGDGGMGSSYWMGREAGERAAYAEMAGVSNSWNTVSYSLLGHTVQLATLQSNPNVTLMFMRLPDGGANNGTEGFPSTNYMTLKKLWQNSIGTLSPLDGSPSYTRQQLIDVLSSRMAIFGPDTIRVQDYTLDYTDADHLDHQSTAYFARAAHQANTPNAHQFVGYMDYPSSNQPANVNGTDLTNNQNAYFAYDAVGNNGNCMSTTSCSDPNLLAWLQRMYTVGSESGSTPWAYETLDGDSGSVSQQTADTGRQPTSITFNNKLYTFYYDRGLGDLRMATTPSLSNPQWTFSTLDGEGGANGRQNSDLGQTPTAVVYGNAIHLFYYDEGAGNIRHAFSTDGSTWYFETLDGDPGSLGGLDHNLGQTPVALVYGSSLQVFYYDATAGNLRHAFYDGSWHFENLEGDPGSISHYDANIGLNPTAVIYSGTLQLFYYDATAGNLRHSWADGTGWHFENLDGDTGSIAGNNTDTGHHPSAVVWNNALHIFYYDATNGNLRHMWTAPSTPWQQENLAGDPYANIRFDGDLGQMTSAMVDTATASTSTLQVLTYDATNQQLVRLWNDGTAWHEEHLDGFGATPQGAVGADAGWDPQAIDFDGRLNVFYTDNGDTNLRHMSLQ